MTIKNAFYAQSGGATAVINATASGLIQTASLYPQRIGKVLAGHNGILGAIHEELIDTSLEAPETIDALKHTPACAFGSCRIKLKSFSEDPKRYERIAQVFEAHHIGYFFYNGGNDSQDTTLKLSNGLAQVGYPVTCIGIPKTIDNDLPFTNNCPGFGSVAKYIAIATQEAALDVASMSASSTKIFILEVMGRHAGWIAAAAGLGKKEPFDPPHVILFPEIPLDTPSFLAKIKETVDRVGYAVVVVSEGIRHPDGRFITESGLLDAFGHEQLGGVAPIIARLIKKNLGYKYHWAVADYLQRSARHIASLVDFEQAVALGQAAIEQALAGKNNVMLTIDRLPHSTYQWTVGSVPLDQVANVEFKMPRDFISEDGYGITSQCREYLLPLIQGEAYPPYKDGLPHYVRLKNYKVEKKLAVVMEEAGA